MGCQLPVLHTRQPEGFHLHRMRNRGAARCDAVLCVVLRLVKVDVNVGSTLRYSAARCVRRRAVTCGAARQLNASGVNEPQVKS